MAQILQFPVKAWVYYCPACGYSVSRFVINMMSHDYWCAGCGDARLSDYRQKIVNE